MNSVSLFYCSDCKKKFEAEKTRIESVHPIYGHCWKYTANCPDCGVPCEEYKVKAAIKSSSGEDCCMESGGGHPHSGCCCCN